MTIVKLTTKKGKGNLFTIECYVPSFEPQNESVCKQHATMFKNDKYTFNPCKDLVIPCRISLLLIKTWPIYSIGYPVAQES
jgi:hypothetical protein